MGPTSCTGPKTSRAARDRPEPNPRRNQPSRYRRSIAGVAVCLRRRHKKNRTAAARNVAPSATHGRTQGAAHVARPAAAHINRPSHNSRPAACDIPRRAAPDQRAGQQRLSCAAESIFASASKLRPWRHASSHRRPPRATSARPSRTAAPDVAQPSAASTLVLARDAR
ncbi:hypothetical protein F511_46814 [Dorcoceras hygrometricum]|uniref:Uncharacterized protein n=1 Tax=Dorcoceras hygrometricum TaxID=472368 RepID=A0A2Z6ZTM5_9LAMI|nr:hypothetical protein F511_46814 [Dorcoceras hygrometricum]